MDNRLSSICCSVISSYLVGWFRKGFLIVIIIVIIIVVWFVKRCIKGASCIRIYIPNRDLNTNIGSYISVVKLELKKGNNNHNLLNWKNKGYGPRKSVRSNSIVSGSGVRVTISFFVWSNTRWCWKVRSAFRNLSSYWSGTRYILQERR